jgi:trans-aconitate methyltransferase
MANDWQRVWNKKSLNTKIDSVQAQLLEADGFTSSFGGLHDLDAYQAHIQNITRKLELESQDSIYEVGCGSGAFLYPFYQAGHQISGLDYSESLIGIARDVMPKAVLEVGEAINIPEHSSFDIVFSNGVFLYFPDHNYAAQVLTKMMQMTRKSIGIFDIPDAAKQEEDIARRKAAIGEAEYLERYKNLDHLYYSKDWFEQIASDQGFKVIVEDQTLKNYGNSDYRFNVYMYRSSR